MTGIEKAVTPKDDSPPNEQESNQLSESSIPEYTKGNFLQNIRDALKACDLTYMKKDSHKAAFDTFRGDNKANAEWKIKYWDAKVLPRLQAATGQSDVDMGDDEALAILTGEPVAEPEPIAEDSRTLTLCAGTSKYNHTVDSAPLTWDKFKARLARTEVGEKDGPYWIRGVCHGGIRGNRHMSTYELLVIDGDKSVDIKSGEIVNGCIPPVKAVNTLIDMGLDFVLHTSHSHNPGEGINKWRAVVLPTRPLSSEAELIACTNYLHHKVNVELNGNSLVQVPEAGKAANPWYFPRVRDDAALADFYSEWNKDSAAQPLDVGTALEWQAAQPVPDNVSQSAGMVAGVTREFNTDTPINWYNSEHDIEEVLIDNGFTFESRTPLDGDVITRWQSPYVSDSPGTISFAKSGRVMSHNTNCPLSQNDGGGAAHDAFSAYTMLKFDGDTDAAKKAVAAEFRAAKTATPLQSVESGIDATLDGISDDVKAELLRVAGLSIAAQGLCRTETYKKLGLTAPLYDKLMKQLTGMVAQKAAIENPQQPGLLGAAVEPSMTTVLVEAIKGQSKLFHDAEGKGYAAIQRDSHVEVYPMQSTAFSKYVRYTAYQHGCNEPDIAKKAISQLEGLAEFEGEEHEAHRRAALFNGKYYIDLCNKDWSVIEVDALGWRHVAASPLYFIRDKGALPLPFPDASGSLDDLWKFVHIEDIKDKSRYVTALLGAFMPDTQYPVLSSIGEAGSGKTSVTHVFKQLTDPHKLMVDTEKTRMDDMQVFASKHRVLAIQNLSGLTSRMSDLYCTISTGGQGSKRTLFSDVDETIMSFKCQIVCDSINFIIEKQDLIDRSVVFDIPKLLHKTPHSDWLAGMERALPALLGGLLNTMAQCLSLLDSVQPDTRIRMTDYAKLGEAYYKVSGQSGSFSADLIEHQSWLRERSAGLWPIIGRLINWAHADDFTTWTGTLSELRGLLSIGMSHRDEVPKPRQLSALLALNAKLFEENGIKVESLHKHSNRGNMYQVSRLIFE